MEYNTTENHVKVRLESSSPSSSSLSRFNLLLSSIFLTWYSLAFSLFFSISLSFSFFFSLFLTSYRYPGSKKCSEKNRKEMSDRKVQHSWHIRNEGGKKEREKEGEKEREKRKRESVRLVSVQIKLWRPSEAEVYFESGYLLSRFLSFLFLSHFFFPSLFFLIFSLFHSFFNLLFLFSLSCFISLSRLPGIWSSSSLYHVFPSFRFLSFQFLSTFFFFILSSSSSFFLLFPTFTLSEKTVFFLSSFLTREIYAVKSREGSKNVSLDNSTSFLSHSFRD